MGSSKDCAIIPAYNEGRTISEVVSIVKKAGILPLVVDDNSSDDTSKLAKDAGAIVLRQFVNLGKGEAIKKGIEYAFEKLPEMENFVFIDADMQYDPRDSSDVLKPLKDGDADLVMGYRDWSSVPFRHMFGNMMWRLPFNILFGTRFKDTNCGLMAMNKTAAKNLKKALHGGYIIENAILAEAVRQKMRVLQVPVKVKYNHRSEVGRGVRMVGGIFLFIVSEGLKYRLGKR